MSLNAQKPKLWAMEMLVPHQKALVYGDSCNHDYEGQIKSQGSSVQITTMGEINIFAYTRNVAEQTQAAATTWQQPEQLDLSAQSLVITEASAFNFEIDDADKAQLIGGIMPQAMARAAYKMKDTVDRYVAGIMVAGAANTLTTAPGSGVTSAVATPRIVGTGAGEQSIYNTIVDLGVLLDENDVPAEGRWLILPPWGRGQLQLDDRFTSFGTVANLAAAANGKIGECAGFEIRVSNNVPNASSAYSIVAGVKAATTFAAQLNKIETYRPEQGFADAVKGLNLYGAKVTRPSDLVKVYAKRGT